MNTPDAQDFILSNYSAKVLNCSKAGIVAQSNINKKCGFFSLEGDQIFPCIFDSIDNHIDGSVILYYKGTEISFTKLTSNVDVKMLFKRMFVLKTSNGNYKCYIRPSDRLYLNPSDYVIKGMIPDYIKSRNPNSLPAEFTTIAAMTKDDNNDYYTVIAEELKQRLSNTLNNTPIH